MADENEQNETTEETSETPEETPVEAVAEEPVPEPEPEAEPAEEAAVEDVEPAPDVAAEAAAAEEPAGDAVPAAEEAEAAAPAPQSGPKLKRKRLPRSQRRQRPKVVRDKPEQRKPIVRLPKPDGERGRRQERRGVVVSAAMDKTIVVMVETIKAHRKYKKVVRRSAKFHAHDEANTAGVGDTVRIVETRPLSKTKNWRLAEVLEKAK